MFVANRAKLLPRVPVDRSGTLHDSMERQNLRNESVLHGRKISDMQCLDRSGIRVRRGGFLRSKAAAEP